MHIVCLFINVRKGEENRRIRFRILNIVYNKYSFVQLGLTSIRSFLYLASFFPHIYKCPARPNRIWMGFIPSCKQ